MLLDKAPRPGGKLRQIEVAGRLVDAGPTVLTLRWVFERIFSEAGSSLDACLRLHRAEVICRHAWQDGTTLDLFADRARSIDAIAQFSDPSEARRYERFADAAAMLYRSTEAGFIDAARPGPFGLAASMASTDPASLMVVNPLATLWQTLGGYFTDPRLRQLFARYATYSGGSPFRASATLMLIAHVEEAGVWTIDGGMGALAGAMDKLAAQLDIERAYGCEVAAIETSSGEVSGVRLATGETLPASQVVFNGDAAALAAGLLGESVRKAAPKMAPQERSLSAMATAIVSGFEGFPLTRHNVFFSRDYAAEFGDIFERRQLPRDPTVYLCAQDRPATADAAVPIENGSRDSVPENFNGADPGDRQALSGAGATAGEKALILVNAPADGDTHDYSSTEIEQCWEKTRAVLARCGLELTAPEPIRKTTTPTTFAELFPATGGALYGRSCHGWAAAFQRPGSRTAIRGLYLAGGSAHPGAGVPMAALSGRQAAVSLLADRASTRRYHPAATSGGMSTR